jgi:transcriptional regulator with XRE-family HTH domain
MLSDNIKKHLESRNMSKYKLSKLTGIPTTTIHDIISGKNQNPAYEKISKIANALNTPIAELTGEEEISLEGAYIEVAKVAQDKKIDPDKLRALIDLLTKDDKK